MNDGIRVEWRCFYDEEHEWHVELSACNGAFAAAQDFYTHAADLYQLGRQLADFTGQADHDVRFELGDRSGKFAHFVFLRAFSYDALGHAAVEFACGRCGKPPHRAEASFSILCEVASINRWGELLIQWSNQPTNPLVWSL